MSDSFPPDSAVGGKGTLTQRTGWGYEALAREVSDSLHLRRFCLIALSERVRDESTIRKLCRRLGPEVVEEICRQVIGGAIRERRFVARAARIDSTVVEADVRYPSDLGLAADATRMLAREAAKARRIAGKDAPRVRDRSRATNRRLRTLNRTLAQRTGQGKQTALRFTGQAGELVRRSVAETRRLARRLRLEAARVAIVNRAALGLVEPWIRRLPPDVGHVHLPFPTGELAVLASRWPAPVVVSYRADVAGRQARMVPLYPPLVGALVRRSAALIVGTRALAGSSPILGDLGAQDSVVRPAWRSTSSMPPASNRRRCRRSAPAMGGGSSSPPAAS